MIWAEVSRNEHWTGSAKLWCYELELCALSGHIFNMLVSIENMCIDNWWIWNRIQLTQPLNHKHLLQKKNPHVEKSTCSPINRCDLCDDACCMAAFLEKKKLSFFSRNRPEEMVEIMSPSCQKFRSNRRQLTYQNVNSKFTGDTKRGPWTVV